MTSSAWIIFSPVAARISATCLGNDHFELVRHDVCFPLYVEVDQIYNLACPASPIHYQHDPGTDDQDQCFGSDQYARPCQAPTHQNIAGLHIGGLWRP